VIRSEILTGPDGRFLLGGVPGGRYRVRAYVPPNLAQIEPEVRFLRDGEEHTFDLRVEEQGGVLVRADVAPEPPVVGQAVNLVALVVSRTVGADGIVRSLPVTGVTVELAGLGPWTLRDDRTATTTTTTTTRDATSTSSSSSSTTTTTTIRSAPSSTARTDSAGRVRFELRCNQAGPPGLQLRVPVQSAPPTVTMQPFDLEVPACIDPATTTTAAPTSSTTG